MYNEILQSYASDKLLASQINDKTKLLVLIPAFPVVFLPSIAFYLASRNYLFLAFMAIIIATGCLYVSLRLSEHDEDNLYIKITKISTEKKCENDLFSVSKKYGNYYCTDRWDMNVAYESLDSRHPNVFLSLANGDNEVMRIPINKEECDLLMLKRNKPIIVSADGIVLY